MFLCQRVIDAVCKKGGFECDYDCSVCKTRCAGYHCGIMRQERAAQAENDLQEAMAEIADFESTE